MPKSDSPRLRRVWIDYTVEIAADAQLVSSQMSDIDGWPGWMPGLKAIERTSGPFVPGTHFKLVLASNGFDMRMPCELVNRSAQRVEWRLRVLGSTVRHLFEIKSSGPGRTALRHLECGTGLFAVIALPFEKLIYQVDRSWSESIRDYFQGAAAPVALSSV